MNGDGQPTKDPYQTPKPLTFGQRIDALEERVIKLEALAGSAEPGQRKVVKAPSVTRK